MSLSSISDALDALRAGKPVIVADDENRENEGDVVLSAELATPEWIAWTVRWSSGFICAPMPAEWADRLDLPPMVEVNEDARGTAYTVSVDAADRVSTGISASDRAHTLNVLADPQSTPTSVIRPGHILPLRAVDGGVRERGGHTEAAVELMRLAGLRPVGAIAEVVAEDGSMMRLPGLIELGERDGVPVITIEQLIAHLDEHHPVEVSGHSGHRRRVSLRAEANVPTSHGEFRFLAYKDRITGTDHLAVVSGDLTDDAPLVRVHSECLSGEAFDSLKCECGPQLEAALDAIEQDGGVVIYMRGHEGRGIGLINKLRAYSLQERGLDTVDANLALGLPADARDYAAAAGILADLGVEKVRLLTNNTDKVTQLRELGLEIVEQVPLLVGVGPNNHQYLSTKRDRMGHLIAEEDLTDALAQMHEGAGA
ncbi:3,4-dihydroxy 2-butanone 4-phosphate synthase / GTP cyclohydrolase II [Microbacterium sp. cf046]|uniref:GTP cyclohydrolase II n=1 Tax=Microbacterium sp. cf046 TaxID=1761803 RepID=UPI0008E40491|nr:GTP cyclohydrolase II [Microbacterium sp. cf046]SFR95335.1 3,4-dihydroxy 2-butanone 4-phosphate synthase / GTP cyclohydrolase II [Microbacterium sp. cf046]